MDYYNILEVDRNATPLEIRQKYIALSLRYHPDKNIHLDKKEYIECEEKFKNISRAFTVLSDPDEKLKYDKMKNIKSNIFYSYQNENENFTVSSKLINLVGKVFSNESIQSGKDFINVFTKFVNLNNINCEKLPEIIKNYNTFFTQKNIERTNNNQIINIPKQKKMTTDVPHESRKDIIYDINVSLNDIYNEVPKELNVSRYRICHYCLGKGYMGFEINMSLCHVCKGLMKILENKTFPIDIRNKQILFKGDGNQEPDKDPYDLIININPKPDTRFKIINQYDLIYEYNISLIELYTEIKVKLTHLDNRNYLFKYNARNEGSNKILRMKMLRVRDLGLPINNSGRRGDLYIELNVVFPELSNEAIKQLESLKIFNLNQTKIDNNLNDYVEITCELPKIENET
jgi:DnaJ-class molecular chaperone